MSEILEPNPEGDWPEDWQYENGQYTCKCCNCKDWFQGHKRRVTCKKCFILSQQSEIDRLKEELAEYKDRFTPDYVSPPGAGS